MARKRPTPTRLDKASGTQTAGLDRVMRSFELETQRAFQQSTNHVLSNLDEMTRMLLQSNYEGAIAPLINSYVPLGDTLTDQFMRAGRMMASEISTELSQPFGFDVLNPRTLEMMRAMRDSANHDFTDTAAQTARNTLLRSLSPQFSPNGSVEMGAVARALTDATGLSWRQEQAIQNYEQLLRSGSREAFSRALRDRRSDTLAGRALSEDQIKRMVAQYRANYRKSQAKLIARMNALRALNAGRYAALLQADGEGLLTGINIVRTWHAVGDTKTRDSHGAMQGQVQGINDPFLSGLGNYLMYPGDPDAPAEDVVNCRCQVDVAFQRG